MRKWAAFSLIEMLVTISIIGIIAGFSLPMLSHFMQHTSDADLSASLVNVLQLAQREAVVRQVPVGMCLSGSQNKCVAMQGDRLILFTEDHQIIFTSSFKMPRGQLHSRSYPFYRDYIMFSSSDFAQSDNATFWYCHQDEQLPAWVVALGKFGNVHQLQPDRHGIFTDTHGKRLLC